MATSWAGGGGGDQSTADPEPLAARVSPVPAAASFATAKIWPATTSSTGSVAAPRTDSSWCSLSSAAARELRDCIRGDRPRQATAQREAALEAVVDGAPHDGDGRAGGICGEQLAVGEKGGPVGG
ncbi:MAG: hypothetical protein WKF86_04830 [Acidimicrobiales bacterium]